MFSRHFTANDRSLEGRHRDIEVRYDDDTYTDVDEVVTSTFHLERMDDDHVWMVVNGLHINVYIKGRALAIGVEPDDCTPYETKGKGR